MFRPSVKIKPKKPNLYFNKSVTTFDDNEVGNFGFGSNTGILRCAVITLAIPASKTLL